MRWLADLWYVYVIGSLIRFGCPRHILHTLEDDWEHGIIRCIHCGRTEW